MVSRPGSGFPMDWNVLRPMITGRPSVSSRKWRKSVFNRQINWLSRPITPFSAAATTMTTGKLKAASPGLVGQPPQSGVCDATNGPAIEQDGALALVEVDGWFVPVENRPFEPREIFGH